jgi:CBS domain-containing protein
VDPLEILFVRDVMRTKIRTFTNTTTVADLADFVHRHENISQRLFPILDSNAHLIGVITHKQILDSLKSSLGGPIADWMNGYPLTASPHDSLRMIANRMAEYRLTRLPVVDSSDPRRLLGLVSLRDLLRARAQNMKDEVHLERTLGPNLTAQV